MTAERLIHAQRRLKAFGRWGVLANGNFALLAGGQLLSGLGSQVTLLALPTLAVLDLRASASDVGLLVAAGYLAAPIVGLPSGVLVERLRSRAVMVVMDVVRLLSVGLVPLSAWLGFLTVPLLCAVAFVVNGCSVIYQTANQSLLPQLVERRKLVDANAVAAASQGVTSVAGPSLGGGLVGLLGAAQAVFADMASYVISIGSVLAIRRRDGPSESEAVPRGVRRDGEEVSRRGFSVELMEGIRFVAARRDLRTISFTIATLNLGGGAVGAVIYPYVYRVLHLSPSLVGGAFATGSLGIFLGAAAGRRVVKRGAGQVVLGAAVGAPCAFLLLLAAVGAPIGVRFVVVAAYNLVFTVSAYILAIYQQTLRQLSANRGLQARTYSVVNTVSAGTVPLGALLGAWVAGSVGLRGVVIVGAGAGLLGAMWLVPGPKMDVLLAESNRAGDPEDEATRR